MGLQDVLAVVLGLAILALEWFVSKVTTFVVPHVSLGPETLSAALWALERPLIDVDPHVNA